MEYFWNTFCKSIYDTDLKLVTSSVAKLHDIHADSDPYFLVDANKNPAFMLPVLGKIVTVPTVLD